MGFAYFEVCDAGMSALSTLRFVVWGCWLCLLWGLCVGMWVLPTLRFVVWGCELCQL